MSGHPGVLAADVRLLRQEQLDGRFAGALALQRLAEVTHLPTGIVSDQVETVDVPAGGGMAAKLAASGDTLLHVVAGHVRVQWGNALDREMRAGPGDTLLVPAGTAFRADNASQAALLQLILVRGG